MDPRNQMRWGALLALLTLALPFLASLLAGVLEAMGYSPEALEPAFRLLVPLMLLVFVLAVVMAVIGFLRRAQQATSEPLDDEDEW